MRSRGQGDDPYFAVRQPRVETFSKQIFNALGCGVSIRDLDATELYRNAFGLFDTNNQVAA